MDFAMLGLAAAMERTLEQWRLLLDGADMQLLRICEYNEETGDSILVTVPKAKK